LMMRRDQASLGSMWVRPVITHSLQRFCALTPSLARLTPNVRMELLSDVKTYHGMLPAQAMRVFRGRISIDFDAPFVELHTVTVLSKPHDILDSTSSSLLIAQHHVLS
jgi:hypothetical protein